MSRTTEIMALIKFACRQYISRFVVKTYPVMAVFCCTRCTVNHVFVWMIVSCSLIYAIWTVALRITGLILLFHSSDTCKYASASLCSGCIPRCWHWMKREVTPCICICICIWLYICICICTCYMYMYMYMHMYMYHHSIVSYSVTSASSLVRKIWNFSMFKFLRIRFLLYTRLTYTPGIWHGI